MLLQQRSPDGLSRMCCENQINCLIFQGIKNLLRRFFKIHHEPFQSLLDVGFGSSGVLVRKVSLLQFDAPSISDLNFFGQVGEVEHVREGSCDDDGISRV